MSDKENIDSRIYIGAVSHRRLQPVAHRFKYRVFSVLFNIDELTEMEKVSTLFRHNRWGVMSFQDKDHGAKDGSPLRPWIEQKLKEGGYNFPLGKVQILCFPRLFGFVFNPLSVWYCYDTNDKIRAILYEVRNTFKEWRGYLLPVQEGHESTIIKQSCDKTFYVSPLMNMECTYHFSMSIPSDSISIGIRETSKKERTLLAVQTGKALPFTKENIKKTLLKYPLMYFKVVAAIHWEALRTLIKGAKFHWNPRDKSGDVTYPDK